jgi:hypothetical protein
VWRLARRACVLGLLASTALGLWAFLRPNQARVSPALGVTSWPAVADGKHNSNTDLIHWRGSFYLVHATAPWHFASARTELVLLRSADARDWTEVTRFHNPGEDIRDPKFAVIGGRLFLYWLNNRGFPEPTPYSTRVSWSEDGARFEPARGVGHEGWLFWRPKTPDGGRSFYVTAYWHEHGKAALFRSQDGLAWERVSLLHEAPGVDETDLEFLRDGRALATARVEGRRRWFGDPDGYTLLAVAAPPYVEWTRTRSFLTRLDGPRLFSVDGRVYAVGRFEPGPKQVLSSTGSILGRKRTALYLVEPDRLVWLSDLPSAGDTSYAGVVEHEGSLYVSYYTSRVDRDWPWIYGMLARSDILMARVSAVSLSAAAQAAGARAVP